MRSPNSAVRSGETADRNDDLDEMSASEIADAVSALRIQLTVMRAVLRSEREHSRTLKASLVKASSFVEQSRQTIESLTRQAAYWEHRARLAGTGPQPVGPTAIAGRETSRARPADPDPAAWTSGTGPAPPGLQDWEPAFARTEARMRRSVVMRGPRTV